MKRAIITGLYAMAAVLSAAATATAADAQLYDIAYRPLTDIAAQYAMKLAWITPAKTVRLTNDYCTLEFTVHERSLKLNGQPLALGAPIVANRGTLLISKRDFEHNILPLLSPQAQPNPPALRRIVIDPGHGGHDSGALNEKLGLREETLTLDVAQRLAAVLQKRGYEVVLTRDKDVFIEREERTAIANRAKGDLFISVHFNTVGEPSVSGVETFILTPPWQPSTKRSELRDEDKVVLPGNRFDFWNTIAGFSVQRAVAVKLKANNRGIKRERFNVLTGLNMPGLLVECGFISNAGEGAKIKTAAHRQSLAESIADGVDLYKKTLDRLRGRAAPAKPQP